MVQLVLLQSTGRFLVYDEAIYVSQLNPEAEPLMFSAPRARGLVWLIAPVTAFGAGVEVVRLWMLLLTSVLFFVAFRSWLPTLGRRALVAAVFFGTTWLVLFSGMEVYPNLLLALGAVTAAGYLAQHLLADEPARRPLWLAGAAVLGTVLVRPSEATFIAVAFAAVAVSRQPRVLALRWGILGGAVVLGWLPWVVEAYTGFGGLRARFAAASANVGTGDAGPLEIAADHLRLTQGALANTATQPEIPVLGVLWWLLLAGAAAAVILRRCFGHDRAAFVAAAAALASVVQNLVLTSVIAARFLLPVYALCAVCVAAVCPPLERRAVAVVVGVLLAGWASWNIVLATGVADRQTERRGDKQRVAELLRERAGGRPCLVATQQGFPEIQVGSGCVATQFDADAEVVELRREPGSARVFVVGTRKPAKTPILRQRGRLELLDRHGVKGWWLFEPADRSILRGPAVGR